jgi:hypothetical protein
MLGAAECRAHAETCRMLSVAPEISMRQATIYMSMAQSWFGLAGQMDRLEAIKIEEA